MSQHTEGTTDKHPCFLLKRNACASPKICTISIHNVIQHSHGDKSHGPNARIQGHQNPKIQPRKLRHGCVCLIIVMCAQRAPGSFVVLQLLHVKSCQIIGSSIVNISRSWRTPPRPLNCFLSSTGEFSTPLQSPIQTPSWFFRYFTCAFNLRTTSKWPRCKQRMLQVAF